jgi:hypothetical protein
VNVGSFQWFRCSTIAIVAQSDVDIYPSAFHWGVLWYCGLIGGAKAYHCFSAGINVLVSLPLSRNGFLFLRAEVPCKIYDTFMRIVCLDARHRQTEVLPWHQHLVSCCRCWLVKRIWLPQRHTRHYKVSFTKVDQCCASSWTHTSDAAIRFSLHCHEQQLLRLGTRLVTIKCCMCGW